MPCLGTCWRCRAIDACRGKKGSQNSKKSSHVVSPSVVDIAQRRRPHLKRQRSMAELRTGGPRSRLNAIERRCCCFEPELSLTWRATARAIVLPEEMRSSSLESLIVDIPPLCDLAVSTNAFDLAVDVRVFSIKTLLRYRRGRVNIGRARLAVACRRRPGSGCSFESSL